MTGPNDLPVVEGIDEILVEDKEEEQSILNLRHNSSAAPDQRLRSASVDRSLRNRNNSISNGGGN